MVVFPSDSLKLLKLTFYKETCKAFFFVRGPCSACLHNGACAPLNALILPFEQVDQGRVFPGAQSLEIVTEADPKSLCPGPRALPILFGEQGDIKGIEPHGSDIAHFHPVRLKKFADGRPGEMP